MIESYNNIHVTDWEQESVSLFELFENSKGLQVLLSQHAKNIKIEICFPPVYSYRCTNESYRLKTLYSIEELPSLISVVENSLFLKWFHEESQDVYEGDNLKHFMIFTGEEFIDIISHVNPSIRVVNQQ